jgi:hypothetical protein
MTVAPWIWKSIVAGLCGMTAHWLLMFFKARAGLVPAFQPYEALQLTLGRMTGSQVHPMIPWLLSFLNGATVIGFIYSQIYRVLPGTSGVSKGLAFGVLGWLVMGLIFFPLLGLGLFAANVGLGATPALFALAMFMTYSVVMGLVYDALSW